MTLRSRSKEGPEAGLQSNQGHYIRQGIILLIPFVLAYFCSAYLVQVMLIQGDSMLPTYRDKQFVLLKKFDRDFERGDVIAFSCEGLGTHLVKRIVGMPGDEIVIEAGKLYLNGAYYLEVGEDEKAQSGQRKTEQDAGEDEREWQEQDGRDGTRQVYVVPDGCYFVLGDNVSSSVDSRDERVGYVAEKTLIGKVWE